MGGAAARAESAAPPDAEIVVPAAQREWRGVDRECVYSAVIYIRAARRIIERNAFVCAPPSIRPFAAVMRQLALNFVTESAHDDSFARLARRFVLARWASDAWSKGDDNTK